MILPPSFNLIWLEIQEFWSWSILPSPLQVFKSWEKLGPNRFKYARIYCYLIIRQELLLTPERCKDPSKLIGSRLSQFTGTISQNQPFTSSKFGQG